jgi:hypothetical protein
MHEQADLSSGCCEERISTRLLYCPNETSINEPKPIWIRTKMALMYTNAVRDAVVVPARLNRNVHSKVRHDKAAAMQTAWSQDKHPQGGCKAGNGGA